jgi:hypothetical protein
MVLNWGQLVLAAEGLPRRKEIDEPGARKRFQNQSATGILPQGGLVAGQFEIAGDSHSLATAVPEEAHLARGFGRWHSHIVL